MIENNTMRIGGLASGMNTDEIIDNLVRVRSMRLDKLEQSKTSSTWKSDAYREVNKQVDEFRKAMENLRLQSTFGKQKVTSGDPRLEVSSAGTSARSDFVISEAKMATSAKPAMKSFASGGNSVEKDFNFRLNDAKIELKKGQTLDQAIASINEQIDKAEEKVNVKASNVGGSLVFTSTDTGEAAAIKIKWVPEYNSLGIKNLVGEDVVKGKDAQSGSVTINDTKIDISSNKFTYEGVTFSLKGNIPLEENSQVGVQVSADTGAIFDQIKTFVDKYNELIEDLNGQISEKKYRDFPPLTEAQRKDLSDKEVELWDEKAKSGLLTNDSTIRSFLTEMRNSLISTVPDKGAFNTLNDIGITFSKEYQDNGKLILDEDKLNGVLQTNLEDVKKLFTSKGTGEPTSTTTVTDRDLHDKSGFGWRIYERLNFGIKQLSGLAGSPDSAVDTQSFIAKQIKNIDEGMTREQQRVQAYEDRLWRQFTAMETALAQMNSQSSWLSQQLGM